MEPLLVVGAGPTGLAATLFLTEAGIRCRVIDRRPNQPLPHAPRSSIRAHSNCWNLPA